MNPPKIVIVGAGIVGLSTAWYAQELGADVVVVDRGEPQQAASWGNAGWVTPAMTMPLPNPAILTTGIKAALSPGSPVYIPPTANLKTIRFLWKFARHCTAARWHRGMETYAALNRDAIAAFERLGIDKELKVADPLLIAFRRQGDQKFLLDELTHIAATQEDVRFAELDRSAIHALEPALGPEVTSGIRLEGQRYIDPRSFVHELAQAVQSRGGEVVSDAHVQHIQSSSVESCHVQLQDGTVVTGSAVVLAAGAWLGQLAHRHGVKTLVQAGRGYSFTVQPESMPNQPIYFPTQRVACTPIAGGFRVAGMMEFAGPDAPLNPKRVDAIVNAARPMLRGIDWDARTEEWVGSRPCTPDGLPLVGRTKTPNVYVCGGHGMWGVALGPLSGQLLAAQMLQDKVPPVLKALDPLR